MIISQGPSNDLKPQFNFVYKINGETKSTHDADNDDFTVDCTQENGCLLVTLLPKADIEFEKFELSLAAEYTPMCRIFTNGYQSWTVSREYAPKDRMDEFEPRVHRLEKKKINPLGIWCAGDLTFHDYPERDGIFYGYSYGYIRQGGDITLYASLSERAGYTIITFDTNESSVTVGKDLQGVTFTDRAQVLSLLICSGDYDSVFDRYFELMDIAKPRVQRSSGYTTWYNYYTNVTEDIVRRDLDSIARLGQDIDFFQIDDGYERAVGDWLVHSEKKFPSGMKAVADEIHAHNMKAGLWLAPFAAVPRSELFRKHRDWLVRDSSGKMHFASHNWGGFFALDIYNERVREYLREVFDTVLGVWGYDMVKLDFLYACCIIPVHGKSRGEIMCDAMDFLRELCGDKIILGCGVPLAPAFGKVDFCRIGADMGLCWENKAFSREDVSTQHALLNAVFRRHLDGRAFLNDPDVFLLRDNNIKMPAAKRELIAEVNSLCGNLLFVSDDVAEYSQRQKRIFSETVNRPKAKITATRIDINDNISVDYSLEGENKNLTFNIKSGEKRLI